MLGYECHPEPLYISRKNKKSYSISRYYKLTNIRLNSNYICICYLKVWVESSWAVGYFWMCLGGSHGNDVAGQSA
jgi:hypothetical protein